MGIVRFALRFPHTFYVLAMLMLFLGVSAIVDDAEGHLPQHQHPCRHRHLAVHRADAARRWSSGSPPTANIRSARTSATSATSRARPCRASSVQKIYFQPNVNIDLAISQIVSATNSIRALMPPGIQPPIIVQYNASSRAGAAAEPQLRPLNEQQLYDYGIYQMRQALAPIPGITLPTPYGGKYRQIMVDLDPDALRARGHHAERRASTPSTRRA